MLKRAFSVLMLVLGLCLFLGTSMETEAAVAMKWGHTNAPGMASYEAPELFAKTVEELSKGQITCKVYPQSQLGGERDLIESVKLGTIQIVSPSIAPVTLSDPRVGVYELPFVFKDRAHILRTAQGPVGQKIAKGLEEKSGLKILDYFWEGGRGLYNNKGPVTNPDDMKGRKIRIMEAEMYKDMFSAVGALPTPLPFAEVYTALATNLVDFADPDIANYRAMKHFEVAKFYTFSDHVMIFKPVLINAKFFNALSPEDQEIVRKAMEVAAKFQRDRDQSLEKDHVAWLEKQGVKINTANKAAFREKMKVVYEKAKQRLGKEFVEEFMNAAKATE